MDKFARCWRMGRTGWKSRSDSPALFLWIAGACYGLQVLVVDCRCLLRIAGACCGLIVCRGVKKLPDCFLSRRLT
ncbi:MAG: hypothetical protein WBK83_07760 [Dysgonamonadaceae bacterium]